MPAAEQLPGYPRMRGAGATSLHQHTMLVDVVLQGSHILCCLVRNTCHQPPIKPNSDLTEADSYCKTADIRDKMRRTTAEALDSLIAWLACSLQFCISA